MESRTRSLFVLLGLACLTGAAIACQQYVFSAPFPTGARTVEVQRPIEVQPAADILFVVDNSLSMSEEQVNLGRNSSSLCRGSEPCTNPCGTEEAVRELKEFMKEGDGRGVDPANWTTQFGDQGTRLKGILDDCGFIERLQLFDNDFQIGIITTDDNDLERGSGGDGGCAVEATNTIRELLPQRGCLQTEPNPPGGRRIITPRDGTIRDISNRFYNAIVNVSTCGSGYEEGLDSIKEFTTPDASRADPACANDLKLFLRSKPCLKVDGGMQCQVDDGGQPVADESAPTPKLVIIILSDEEDCSHYEVGQNNEFITEYGPQNPSTKCYDIPAALRPVSEFVNHIRALRPDPTQVSMASIVGGVIQPDGTFRASGCRCNTTAPGAAPYPEGGDHASECYSSKGQTNSPRECGNMVSVDYCGALADISTATAPTNGHGPCCSADPGGRYVEATRAMSGTFLLDSICSQNYRETMIKVANLANETGVVQLEEVPADLGALRVEMKRGANADWESVPPFASRFSSTPRTTPEYRACTGCPCMVAGATQSQCNPDMECEGYSLVDGCRAVKFHGSWVPKPGTQVRIRFLGERPE